MKFNNRLLKLESIKKHIKRLSLIFIENKKTTFQGKSYSNFEQIEKDYPSIRNDYDLNVISIVREK